MAGILHPRDLALLVRTGDDAFHLDEGCVLGAENSCADRNIPPIFFSAESLALKFSLGIILHRPFGPQALRARQKGRVVVYKRYLVDGKRRIYRTYPY